MSHIDEWTAAYGPTDGAWLLDEFQRVTQQLKHVDHIRIARQGNAEEIAQYRDAIFESAAVINGDWYVTSPATGLEYRMGCDWRD
jgi:hypothetical protein